MLEYDSKVLRPIPYEQTIINGFFKQIASKNQIGKGLMWF